MSAFPFPLHYCEYPVAHDFAPFQIFLKPYTESIFGISDLKLKWECQNTTKTQNNGNVNHSANINDVIKLGSMLSQPLPPLLFDISRYKYFLNQMQHQMQLEPSLTTALVIPPGYPLHHKKKLLKKASASTARQTRRGYLLLHSILLPGIRHHHLVEVPFPSRLPRSTQLSW